MFDCGELSYSLMDYGAWFDHKNLTLVRRADKDSLSKLAKFQEEEYDEGED